MTEFVYGIKDDYAKAVNAALRKKADYIASGKCSTLEDYKAKCGERTGLKEALELFNDVAKRYGELDEDDGSSSPESDTITIRD